MRPEAWFCALHSIERKTKDRNERIELFVQYVCTRFHLSSESGWLQKQTEFRACDISALYNVHSTLISNVDDM